MAVSETFGANTVAETVPGLDAGAEDGAPFAGTMALGVACSILGQQWVLAEASESRSRAIAEAHALPQVVARILASRGVELTDVEAFLRPTLRSALPDPQVLTDMDTAATILADAVERGTSIGLFGDYDVDGATSSALLLRYLRCLGLEPRLHIPDRIAEGYGPNSAAFDRLIDSGAELIVTVDCGVTAHEPIAHARSRGVSVVVVDHHQVPGELPQANALVDPDRDGGIAGLSSLAAVGVTFLLLVATNRVLRERGYFTGHRDEPNLLCWLDLVALGTVCDVVPLVGVNRALVAQGLKVMGQFSNPGLKALAEVAGMKRSPDSYHAGFILGPRVNAGGRVGRSDLGARLLACDDPEEARALAEQLDSHNRERRELEQQILAAATIDGEPGDDRPFALASGDGWHPGVIGIVASRLKDRSRKPSVVVAFDGDIGKASARSIPGVDLGRIVLEAERTGLVMAGGGHAMAAGFTVHRSRLADLETFLETEILAEAAADRRPRLTLDGVLAVGGVNGALYERLAALGPYGAGNPEPRFAVANATLVRADVVGQVHVRCVLGDDAGGGTVKAIAFRAMQSTLGEALLSARGRPVHVAGIVRQDDWAGGRAVQLQIDDLAIPGREENFSSPPV